MIQIKPGDILLFKRRSKFISPLVRWFTRSEYTHVGMAFSDRLIFEIDLGKNLAIHPIVDEEFEVYRYKKSLTTEQLVELKNHAIQRASISKGYDWFRIIAFAFERFFQTPRALDMKNRKVCSEIVDVLYSDIGIDLVPSRPVGHVRPSDLAQSSELIHIGTFKK